MTTWAQIDAWLREPGNPRSLVVLRSQIEHPSTAGAERGTGLPRGQTADWRFPPRADCSSMHVREYAGTYDVHVDAKHPRCDLWGHVDQDVMPEVMAMLRAAGALARDFFARTSATTEHRRVVVAGPVDCKAAIVLVATDRTDALSSAIDSVTGGLGWSHVYVDPCLREAASGSRAIVDFTPSRGVHWSTDDAYRARARVRVELDAATSSEIVGCVRARVRQPWSVESFGIDEAVNCVGMVVGCLPWQLQERLRDMQVGPCISPNTLAAYFGVGHAPQ